MHSLNRKSFLLVFILIALTISGCSSGSGNGGGNGNVTEEYLLTITVSPEEGGVVIVSPSGYKYRAGTEVTLHAVPNEGWLFSCWEGDLSGSESQKKLIMNKDKNVTAKFAEIVMSGLVNGAIAKERMGPAVAGVQVKAVTGGIELNSTTTDENGCYSLAVPIGVEFDLIAAKEGSAVTRYQGIYLNSEEQYRANMILKEKFFPGWSSIAPVIKTDLERDTVIKGQFSFSVTIEAGNDIDKINIGIGEEYPSYIGTSPSFTFDSRLYPDGPTFIHIEVFDKNNNSAITRIPVVIDNQDTDGLSLKMTMSVLAKAYTLGDEIPPEKVLQALTAAHPELGMFFRHEFTALAAEEKSLCYVLLQWEAEFSEATGFRGYNVYRSSNPDGPWKKLGTGWKKGTHYELLDATPDVTPGETSYYKVVPFTDNGYEGEEVKQSVTPLGRFEVNLVSPGNNSTGVPLRPVLVWTCNDPGSSDDNLNFEYDIYIQNLSDAGERATLTISAFEVTDNSEIYDPARGWKGYFPLQPNGKYQWDINYAVAYKKDGFSKAYSLGKRGESDGSYNGAFVFTTTGADD